MIGRYQTGDRHALDELIRRTSARLEILASHMLKGFPRVRAHEQTDDVLQNALIRLTRTLRAITPSSVRDFFGLVAEQLRRELLDLTRYHQRHTIRGQPNLDPADAHADAKELDRWTALQEAIEKLPAEMREVFGLRFYQGCTQAEIANTMGISDRQVRRLWVEACARLHSAWAG